MAERVIIRTIQIAIHVPGDLSDEMANAYASDAVSETLREVCMTDNSAIADWEYVEEMGQKVVTLHSAPAYDIFEDFRRIINEAETVKLFP